MDGWMDATSRYRIRELQSIYIYIYKLLFLCVIYVVFRSWLRHSSFNVVTWLVAVMFGTHHLKDRVVTNSQFSWRQNGRRWKYRRDKAEEERKRGV